MEDSREVNFGKDVSLKQGDGAYIFFVGRRATCEIPRGGDGYKELGEIFEERARNREP